MALEYLREYRTYFDWLARVSCYRNIRWIEDTLIFSLPGKKALMDSSRWYKTAVWEQVFKALAEEADNEYAMIDSTIVRAVLELKKKRVTKPLDEAKGVNGSPIKHTGHAHVY